LQEDLDDANIFSFMTSLESQTFRKLGFPLSALFQKGVCSETVDNYHLKEKDEL
jgi:hypothetical protein